VPPCIRPRQPIDAPDGPECVPGHGGAADARITPGQSHPEVEAQPAAPTSAGVGRQGPASASPCSRPRATTGMVLRQIAQPALRPCATPSACPTRFKETATASAAFSRHRPDRAPAMGGGGGGGSPARSMMELHQREPRTAHLTIRKDTIEYSPPGKKCVVTTPAPRFGSECLASPRPFKARPGQDPGVSSSVSFATTWRTIEAAISAAETGPIGCSARAPQAPPDRPCRIVDAPGQHEGR